jgi:hypothetical protein
MANLKTFKACWFEVLNMKYFIKLTNLHIILIKQRDNNIVYPKSVTHFTIEALDKQNDSILLQHLPSNIEYFCGVNVDVSNIELPTSLTHLRLDNGNKKLCLPPLDNITQLSISGDSDKPLTFPRN